MKKQQQKKRFAVGANVRVVMPGVNGIVTQVDDQTAALGEYWHRIQTTHGERKEPGSNLELIPQPAGEPTMPNMQARLVAFFRSLEQALDEHKAKGTPDGDPVYQKIYEALTGDLAEIGVGQDQIEQLAQQCGH